MNCVSSIDSECKSRWGKKIIVLSDGADRAVSRLSNHLQNVNNNIAVHIHILPHCSLNPAFRFDSNTLLIVISKSVWWFSSFGLLFSPELIKRIALSCPTVLIIRRVRSQASLCYNLCLHVELRAMMADQDKPRVKLPGVIMRKPMVPGPNSWAQSRQEQQGSSTGEQLNVGRVTNRDKYEHKPMPPPPPDSSPPNQHMQAKTYIQPAIPLVNSAPAVQIQQKRAVTDPVAPKPLFAGRKLSVAKLRKKYSFSKAKDEAPEAEAMPTIQSSPAVRISSEKAAEVLGLYPPRENKPDTPLASASLAPGPDPFRSSSDSVERTASPARQVQSTPVLTRRYIKENGLPTPTVTAAPTASNQGANEDTQNQIQDPKKAGDAMFTPGMLHPPRLRRYENVGEVGLVEANGMHRVESFSGVIENAEFSPGINGGMYTGSAGACSQSSMIQGLSTGDLLPPVIYSPSNYGGVWENDPAVVSRSTSSKHKSVQC